MDRPKSKDPDLFVIGAVHASFPDVEGDEQFEQITDNAAYRVPGSAALHATTALAD
jgi:hypothetical protein